MSVLILLSVTHVRTTPDFSICQYTIHVTDVNSFSGGNLSLLQSNVTKRLQNPLLSLGPNRSHTKFNGGSRLAETEIPLFLSVGAATPDLIPAIGRNNQP